MACVMHTSFATGVATIPDNATDTDIATAKVELATPTLTSFNYDSAYQLEEVTGDVTESDFPITKYLKNAESKELTAVTYNVLFDEVLGDDYGDTIYYKWSESDEGDRILVTADEESYDFIINWNYDNNYRVTDGTKGSSINHDFAGLNESISSTVSYSSTDRIIEVYGGAIYTDTTSDYPNVPDIIGNIKGDFVENFVSVTATIVSSGGAVTTASSGGAISTSGIIGNITGDFIGNYASTSTFIDDYYSNSVFAYAYGGAIYNYNSIGEITGDFLGNCTFVSTTAASAYSASIIMLTWPSYAYGGAICNFGTLATITGNFIGNSAVSITNLRKAISYGGAIYNDNIASDIIGDFFGNHTSATITSSTSYSAFSYGGAIYNINVIESIIGDFIANYAISSYAHTLGGANAYAHAFGGAIYNNGCIESISGDFINNYTTIGSSAASTEYASGGAIYNDTNARIYYIFSDFIGNYTYSNSSGAYTYGGAIYNVGTIDSVISNFIENYAITDLSDSAYGGAIYNIGAIGTLTGDFINNHISDYSSYLSSVIRCSGGAIYNEGTIDTITGDFINNYTYSTSGTIGGAIYNKGTIESITSNFINNNASSIFSSSNTFGGSIYNEGTLTLLAQDADILFNDNKADKGEAIYNSSTIYLNAYEGDKITFNDTIYNTGSSANIIIGELDSKNYAGTVVLNAALSGDNSATLALASGTLAFGQYTDSDGVTSYGNISGTKFVITGGDISTMDSHIRETSLGYLTLTATKTYWSLDIDLVSETADTLTASSVSGSGLIVLDGINLLGSSTDDSITVSLTTDSDLMASISTDLSSADFLINGENASDFSAVSYDATTGQLTLANASGSMASLDAMVESSDTIKQYQLGVDEMVSDSLGILAGTSLSIFGSGYNVTADGDDIAGITINDSTQTLAITDVASWSGFSGNAVTNNAGTLSIAAVGSNSTWDDSIVNNAIMSVLASAGTSVTFDAVVTGNGSIKLNDANSSGSIVFNDALTQDEIFINAGSVSFNAEVTGDISMLGGSLDMNGLALSNAIEVSGTATITNANAYTGQVTLTSGSLAGSVNLSQDLLASSGIVTADLSGSAGLQKSGDGTLTLSGNLSYTGATVVNAGTLEVNGTSSTSGYSVSEGASLSLVNSSLSLVGISLDGNLSITQSTLTLSADQSDISSLGSFNIGEGNTLFVLDLSSYSDGEYTLLTAGEITGDINDLVLDISGVSEDITYKLALAGNALVLSIDSIIYPVDSASWISVDGTWGSGEDSDWSVDAPSYHVDALFSGQGTSDVTLVGEQSVSSTVINSDSQDYSFSGDKLSTVTLQIVQGALTINNEVEVSSTASLSDGTSIIINTDASLRIHGALSAENQSITNNGSLSFGQSSVIGSILGTGEIAATGDASIGSLEAGSKLSIVGTGTEITINSNTSLSNLSNEGSLNLAGYALCIEAYSTTGGSITTTEMTLNSGGVFNDLVTDTLTLGTLSSSSYVLRSNSIASMSSDLVVLDLSALSSSTSDATYQLIASTGDALSWSEFKLSDATATAINELIINEGKTITYLIEDGNLSLSIGDNLANGEDLVWDVSSGVASSTDGSIQTAVFANAELSSYDALDQVTQVNVSASVKLDLTELTPAAGESLLVSNMSGFADAALSIVGNGADADSVTLYNDKKTMAQNAVTVEKSTVIVENTGNATALSFGALELDSANLTVLAGASLTVDSLDSSALSVIEGTVNIVGDVSSKLLGSYVDATLNFQTAASAMVYVSDAADLSLTGSSADIQLISASGNAVKSFTLTDSNLTLGAIVADESFTISENSAMSGGTLSISVADSILGAGTSQALITGAGVSLSGTTIAVSSTGSALDVSAFTSSKGIALFTLTEDSPSAISMIASDSTSDSDVTVELVSGSISKYFSNASFVNGVLYADLNTNSYGELALTSNGAAGLGMMNEVLLGLNPQLEANSEKYPDLALVLDGLDAFKADGDKDSADRLGAAIAGASITSLGSASQADLSRQLRSIRSRSKNACLANATILEANGGAWISAEGGYSSLSTDGNASGHDLTSTGASIGAEGKVGETWRVGAAFTLVKGDLSSDAPDRGEADMTTYYGSFYANSNSGRWTHNIVAAIGKIDASMERTVTTNTSGDCYKCKGDTDGMSFALSYELGYSYDLNEEATSTIQPIVALSYVNSSISGYTEDGSDAALTVGDQKNNFVTLGVGVQYDTLVGGEIYNRESLLTTRMMLNIDAGDRKVEADVKLAAMNGSTYTIEGAEPGSVGLEFGLGLDVPVSESSSVFVDVSCEFRSKMTDVAGGIGYRFSF